LPVAQFSRVKILLIFLADIIAMSTDQIAPIADGFYGGENFV